MRKLLLLSSILYSTSAFVIPDLFAGTGQEKSPPVIKSKDKAGREYSTKGYIPMKAGPQTKKFEPSQKMAAGKLPRKVDMRAHMTRIEDQGDTSSCVANAIAGSYEYWVRRSTKQDYDVSRLFVYYNARWRNGDQNKDDGSVIQLAMEGLREFGACSEKRWPFEKPLLLEKPNRDAYQEASGIKIKEMNQVPLDLTAWKQALASGYPVVFGILLFESFDQCNQRGGVVPMPNPKDVGRESHGGHAMTAVGYSDKEQVFIVRNSWGDKWGDQGYCYMPYNYLINNKFNDGDSWVFIPENPIENPEDIWFDDDKPVTDGGEGVEFVINPYTDDDYADVVLTWWEEYELDFTTTIDTEYLQYVEYVEEEQWDLIETFEYEEIIETWEEENPGEDSDLYLYDEEDTELTDEESEELEEAEEETEQSEEIEETEESESDEADDADADDEIAEDEEADEDADDSDAEEDAGDDEQAEDEADEDNGESDEDVSDEDSGDDADESEDEGEESEESDSEDDSSEGEAEDDSGDDEGEEESEDDGGDEGGEDDGGGDDGGGGEGGGDEGGGDDGGGEE